MDSFAYKIIRSNRKTVALCAEKDGTFTVKAPLRMKASDIEDFVLSHRKWMEKASARVSEIQSFYDSFSESDIENMRAAAKTVLPLKVEKYSKIMGVVPNSVKINSAKKRFGSCSGKNDINFSLFLMAKDERAVDYVVVHELAHIRYHDHSKDFYNFIEKFMPDYKEREALLR